MKVNVVVVTRKSACNVTASKLKLLVNPVSGKQLGYTVFSILLVFAEKAILYQIATSGIFFEFFNLESNYLEITCY